MKEKNIQTLLNKPLHKMKRTFFYELKLSKNKAKTVPFSRFQPQQIPSLLQIKHETLAMKLSDTDPRRVFGDGFVAHKEDAFVAVCYYEPRKPKIVYFIPIDEILFMMKSGKKSIHIDDAIKLKEFTVECK